VAILSSEPTQDGQVTLYDIPDDVLQQYKLDPQRAAQMFPEKDSPTRSDAVAAVNMQQSKSGDVQGYAGWICWRYVCYTNGACYYYEWYC